MARTLRLLCSAAAAALLMAVLAFTACAVPVKIDGIAGNAEWQPATGVELAGSKAESNCGIEYAYVKWMVDEKNAAVTLAVFVTADGYESGNTLVAALFVPQAGSQVAVTAAGVQACDDSLYSVQSAFAGMSGESFAWEVRIGFKFGLPSTPMMGIRLRDALGSLSNYYEIPVFAQEGTTATAAETTTHKTQTTKGSAGEPATQKEHTSTNRPAGSATTAEQKLSGTASEPLTAAVTSTVAASNQTETAQKDGAAAAAAVTPSSRRFGFTVAAAAVLIAAAAGISVWAGYSGRKKLGESPGKENNRDPQNPPDDGPEEP